MNPMELIAPWDKSLDVITLHPVKTILGWTYARIENKTPKGGTLK